MMPDGERRQLVKSFRRYTTWRHRRLFLVHLLAALASLFVFAIAWPRRAAAIDLRGFAAVWVFVALLAVGAGLCELRWRRKLGWS